MEMNLKPFPVDELPEIMRDFVKAVAAGVQVAPDMVAVPMLAALCIPLQNRFVVRVDSTYAEPLCLYTLTIARPSERKSAIIRLLETPFWEHQRVMNEDLPEGAKPTTLYVTDATPEKLAKLMTENKGAIALLSDEPDALAVAAGLRYGKSRNLGLMLQAWSAGRVMIQRATNDQRISIDRAVMSVAVMSQPSFVEALMKDGEMSNRGFMQRFLYAKPPSQVGNRTFDKPEIPEYILNEYNYLVTDFLALDTDSLQELRIAEEARQAVSDLFGAIEVMIQQEKALEGWMGKLFGQCIRIAGVLHCVKWHTEAAEHEIELDTIVAVMELAQYFISHAKAAFTEMDVTDVQQDARTLYRYMMESGNAQFTKRELYKLTNGHFKQKRMEAALAELMATNYIMCYHDAADEKKWIYTLADGRGALDESELDE